MRVIAVSEKSLDSVFSTMLAHVELKCSRMKANSSNPAVSGVIEELLKAFVYHVEVMREEIKDRGL